VTVFLVVGPPAVGKSTAARLLAASFARSVLVDVDQIRMGMVVKGAVLPTGPDWSSALVEQLSAARESACGIARAYARRGFDVVIDDFYDPHSGLAEYDAIGDLGTRRAVLLPDPEVARTRSRDRGPEAAAFIAAGIDEVYALMPPTPDLVSAGWTVLDTSGDTPEETRDRLLSLL
jgi:predicted kinase